MQLNVNRFLSDRLVFDENLPEKLRVTNSFWDWCQRIISWIWSPSSYSDENRKTIDCFKKYLIDTLGEERLQRICSRYSLDLDAMARKGSPLLSRDVAKIVIGANNRRIGDAEISLPWGVPDITGGITGKPTEWMARFAYDSFLADRERLQIFREHGTDCFDVFMQNMATRVIKREMDVGTLVPAPNLPDGRAQFYYVSAKIITGEGMVSYIFHPVDSNTNLEPMRLFRGTAPRSGEIDGISSVISDFERDLGRGAYESGKQYDQIIKDQLGAPIVEVGHSLGAAIVQYRLANMDHIQKAYLFCGPGIPAAEVEKFNQKNPKVHLMIRHSVKDRIVRVGGIHLGYRAPSNVEVQFCTHHLPEGENHHTAVPSKGSRYYGVEGGMIGEDRGAELHHANRYSERLRSTFGPSFAYGLRQIRNLFRRCFVDRAETERGLTIGRMIGGIWKVEHFSAV